MAMTALTRTRTELPKRPAPAADHGDSPNKKKVRFFEKMTLEAVSEDIFEKFIESGKLLSSFGNTETDDMGTHVADLIKKELFEFDPIDYKTWRALAQKLHQTLTSGEYEELHNFKKNKDFLEDEMGGGALTHRTFREFMTFQTYFEPCITPEGMLEVARTLPGTATEWNPEDYPHDTALWYAAIFHQVYTPRAKEHWTYDPTIMKDVEKRYTEDEEPKDEEATEKCASPPASPQADGPKPSSLALGAATWPFDTPPHVFEMYVNLQKTGGVNPLALGVEMPETFTEKIMVEIMGNYRAMAFWFELNSRGRDDNEVDEDPDQVRKNAARAAYMSSRQ